MLLVTPQAANKTIGQGGFQIEQMALLSRQGSATRRRLRDPSRVAEVLNRVIEKAWRGCARADQRPARFLGRIRSTSPCRRSSGWSARPRAPSHRRGRGPAVEGEVPRHPERAGVVIGDAIQESVAQLAERLDAPVACGYQHNDSYPGSHPLAVGPLGYNASKARWS